MKIVCCLEITFYQKGRETKNKGGANEGIGDCLEITFYQKGRET